MDLNYSQEENAFRETIRGWLEDQLNGPFKMVRGRGGPGDEHALFDERLAWERKLSEAGYLCLGWPTEYGGQGASLIQEVIFHEEYARARAPGRLSHIGEGLLGPTLIHYGTDAQKTRFLPPITQAKELWCQGYSEPNAGSDLANVGTRAELEGDEWVINGQKIWTSGARWSHWCFVLCRTDPKAAKHHGLSYLLVPMDQDEVEIRPIEQLTGTSEFSEVFFDNARTHKDNIVGPVNGGWKVAMATLSFERGASTLAQQLNFTNEFSEILKAAKRTGASQDPVLRQRTADIWIRLEIMRLNFLRMMGSMQGGSLGREALISKLYWANLHRDMGELAMDILGPEAQSMKPGTYELTDLQRLFLFTRADTIYAGSNQIQRNIIGERGLGLDREPRPSKG